MARNSAKPEEEAQAIDLTPMLDVVFIMLIFFIVTATFIKEAGIEVNRPEATTADEKKRASILIAVSNNNEIWIDKNRVDPRGVRQAIERLLAENPKGTVVIQSDSEASIELLVDITNAAREAGVNDVAVSTEKK
ncbi:ExbD/TolR family protein [Cellvibrio sp. ARAG 10.3]|jgi:biopolymer transport protein ExbD|uniref:ExbD/TolR family protein n=1 Tax=Cellvibrio sp. ARAG 10.3 TaxID=3451358 RepID=UPI003F47ED25